MKADTTEKMSKTSSTVFINTPLMQSFAIAHFAPPERFLKKKTLYTKNIVFFGSCPYPDSSVSVLIMGIKVWGPDPNSMTRSSVIFDLTT